MTRQFVLWLYAIFYKFSRLHFKQLNITEADLYDIRYYTDYKLQEKRRKKWKKQQTQNSMNT